MAGLSSYILGIMTVLIVFLAYSTWVAPITINGINSFTTDTAQTGQTGIITVQQQVDLRDLFAPFVTASDIYASCQLHGGQFSNTPTNVGCWEMVTPIDMSTTCDTALFASIMQQCNAVGATPICSPNNVGCKY